jgi:hypothetical protein
MNDFKIKDNDYQLQLGDILLIESMSTSGHRYNTHIGINVESGLMVHAFGKSKLVEKGISMGIVLGQAALDVEKVTRYVLDEEVLTYNST